MSAPRGRWLADAVVVFLKELKDALRDRRTLAVVLLSAMAAGPLVLVLVSALVGGGERRAEAREFYMQGIENAPTLVNYFARQTYAVRPAPADFEELLRRNRLDQPVVVVEPGFEARLIEGEAPVVEIFSSTSNRRAEAGAGAAWGLLEGFNSEQGRLRLAMRGVAPSMLEVIRVQSRDLADAAAGAVQLVTTVPFFVLMAVLYGALNAALDSTAGERERGSLEPLLMTPAGRLSLVLGKWAAVATVAMLVALLSCLSLLPAPLYLRSETIAAMLRFGPREAAWFLALLLPLAGALSGVLMAIAIRSRSYKEAQASATVVLLAASLLPMIGLFNQEGESPWHLWTPALAQTTLMARVLKGDAVSLGDALVPALTSGVLAALALAYLAWSLRRAALK